MRVFLIHNKYIGMFGIEHKFNTKQDKVEYRKYFFF